MFCNSYFVGRSLAAARGSLYRIVDTHFSCGDVGEFRFVEQAPGRGDMIGVYFTFEVVALMLYDTGNESAEFTLVGLEIAVKPFETYVLHAFHSLGEAGQTQAAFLAACLFAVEHLNLGVDQCKLSISTFRKFFGEGRTVDHHQADIAADLRSSEADTFGVVHRLKHIVYEFLQVGIFVSYFG